jgi:hypothetical protein
MLVKVEDLDLDSSRSSVYNYSTLIRVIDPLKSNIYINISINSLETNSLEKEGTSRASRDKDNSRLGSLGY